MHLYHVRFNQARDNNMKFLFQQMQQRATCRTLTLQYRSCQSAFHSTDYLLSLRQAIQTKSTSKVKLRSSNQLNFPSFLQLVLNASLVSVVSHKNAGKGHFSETILCLDIGCKIGPNI